MDGLKNYREKIENISKLVDKMDGGELSIHELVELESLTRELHERSIILKYKAFENKVGDATSVEVTMEVVHDEEEVEEKEEVVEEKVQVEAPILDFSMFDEPEEEFTPEVKIDVVAEEKEPEVVIEATPEPEPEVAPEPEPEPMKEEPIVPTPQVEPKAEEPTVEVPAEEPKVEVKEKGSSFLDRLSISDNSISSQIAERKIDTLSGAFGINQRLLYINELFDGSGEEFSDAVKMLDTQPGLDDASNKIEELAFKYSWNPEEETVLEFLAIIKRRYA
ncbi:MAG: hypothetical protein HWE22_12180 [Flavobacteriales bacterium]|nr:hypothetical protein [Flavobacteriales bacterium]